MASKLALLILGLLVMVVLVSSMGEARHLVEVATKQNNVDSVKYCAKLSGKTDGDASSDCFMIPGLPSIPGLPTWPTIPGLPGWPGATNQPATPLIPTPPATPLISSLPKVEVATKKNNVDSVKYCAKTNSAKGSDDASSDCFIPGAPGQPWWPWPLPGSPATPGTPKSPSTPGVPGLPWWLWPFIPHPPTTPVTPSPPATPGSPTSSPLR